MAIWRIYDHVDVRGNNTIADWLDSLDGRALGKVHAKIVHLRQYGAELPTSMLSDTDVRKISKLRVTGRINWRILCCKGPVDSQAEFTLLAAVQEKDNKMPDGATESADKLRLAIEAAPATRRVIHEFKKYES
jgi:hypothetical protein